MDRDFILAQIAKAERDVLAGSRNLVAHRGRFERLHKAGRDTTMARTVLLRLEETQDLNVANLTRLRSLLTRIADTEV